MRPQLDTAIELLRWTVDGTDNGALGTSKVAKLPSRQSAAEKDEGRQGRTSRRPSHMEIAAFIGELRQVRGFAARALEFLILMACRVGEVIDATWGELDRDARAWVRSAERMKAPQPHRSRCRTLPWPSSIGCLCFGAVMISCSPDLESADLFPRRQSDW